MRGCPKLEVLEQPYIKMRVNSRRHAQPYMAHSRTCFSIASPHVNVVFFDRKTIAWNRLPASLPEEQKTMDVLTPEQRSRCMPHIRSVDAKPEVFFRRALWKWGARYRKNVKTL
jgi:hypothetical protein